jgi:hypothetical protein
MDEIIKTPSPVEIKRQQKERDAELEQYFASLEKSKAPAILREDEPAIAELEKNIALFRSAHSLE